MKRSTTGIAVCALASALAFVPPASAQSDRQAESAVVRDNDRWNLGWLGLLGLAGLFGLRRHRDEPDHGRINTGVR